MKFTYKFMIFSFQAVSPFTRMAAVTVSSAALLSSCNNIPDIVKIGAAFPLTGQRAAQGQDLLNGVKLAIAELNAEGFKLKDKPVTLELVAVDDKADADTGKIVAQQLVNAGVVAVVGHLQSGASIEAAPVYAAKGIAQLSITTNPQFTDLGLDSTFRLVASDTLQAKAMGSFATKQLEASRFAVLDDKTTHGKGLADGAAAELNKAKKEVVLRASFDDKTTDFAELADKLKAAKVEIIISSSNDSQVLALLEALKKVDHTQLSVLGGDIMKTTSMLKGSGLVKGLYATSPILAASEFAGGAPFRAKYRTTFGQESAYAGHYSYDAVFVIAAAMRREDSADPLKITQSIHTIDATVPVTGSMRWNEKGEQRYGVMGVYQAMDGVWVLQARSDRW